MMTRRDYFMTFIILLLVVSYDYIRMLFINTFIFNTIYSIVLVMLLNVDFLNHKFEKKAFRRTVPIILLCVVSTFLVKESSILLVTIAALSMYKRNQQKCLKYLFNIYTILFVITIFLGILGVLKSHNAVVYITNRTRYSMGFSHPNQVFLYYLPIVFTGYLVFYDKNKIVYNVLVFIISSILMIVTGCRTGFLCIILFLVLINTRLKKNKLLKYVPHLFIILTIITFAVAFAFGKNGDNFLNTILSLRPLFWRLSIKKYGFFNLLGNSTIKYPIDNVYLYTLLCKGIIIYALYIIFYWYYYKNNKKFIRYNAIMVVFLIYGIMESYLLLPSLNFVLMFIILNYVDDSSYENAES